MAYKENYPSKLLEEAVDAISTLPGVGRRSALRLALHLLKQPAENVHHFTSAIDRLRDDVKYCCTCRMISDDDICSICSDKSRDHRTICVVESVRDVILGARIWRIGKRALKDPHGPRTTDQVNRLLKARARDRKSVV